MKEKNQPGDVIVIRYEGSQRRARYAWEMLTPTSFDNRHGMEDKVFLDYTTVVFQAVPAVRLSVIYHPEAASGGEVGCPERR